MAVCEKEALGGMISSRPEKFRYTIPLHTISLRALCIIV